MASRSSRRRKRQKTRQRRRASIPISEDNIDELPRPLRLIVEGADRFAEFVRDAGTDPKTLHAQIRQTTLDAATKVIDAAAPYDAFDVLESVRLSQTPMNPETYSETEHEGTAAVIEFVAILLASRGTRLGTDHAPGDGPRTRPDPVMDEIIKLCREAVEAGSLMPMVSALAAEKDPSPALPIELGAVLRDIFVRNLAYTHMVEDTLTGLFEAPAVKNDCSSVLGFTAKEARAVLGATSDRLHDAWADRFDKLQQLNDLATAEMARERLEGDDYVISDEARQLGIALLNQAWDNVGDAALIDIDDIAGRTGSTTATAQGVVDLFSYEMQAKSIEDTVDEFFSARSPFRLQPILRAPTGAATVVNPAVFVEAIRDRFEQELKADQAAWDRYAKHRGEYVEAETLRLLASCLENCDARGGFQYFIPDPDRVPAEDEPSSYTRLAETDGLVLVDDVALIIEVKAGALTAAARGGDAKRLLGDLRKIVTDASQQANRVRHRILADGGLMLRDRSWLDLAQVREIHSITVSLEDLSGIATITSELVSAGILSGTDLSWTVSLHDLRIVTELIDRPAELLLYLRRRTEPDVTRRFHAVDELDFFLEFCNSGLFVEPDPDRLRSELPQFGEPTVAAKRRYASQQLEFLTSRTDQLDAWYFYETGVRETPAPKPSLNSNLDLQRLVDAVAAIGSGGWLRLGTTMLDAAGPLQRDFARHASDLLKATDRDGRDHTLAVMGGTRAESSFVLIWMSRGRGQSLDQAHDHLKRYVAAKKHQAQVAIGMGLLFDSFHGPGEPARIVYDNRRPGADAALDADVERLELKPLDRVHNVTRVATPRSSGRATPRRGR